MISPKAQEYREELVKKLCDAMEKGTAPWQRTWTDGDAPCNAVSGRAYHSINSINLALQSQALGQPSDPRWLTYGQAQEKGWHVKAGEKGTHVEFYKFDEKPKVDESGDPVLDEDGKQEVEKSVLVRNYVVFHASQIEVIPAYEPPARNPIETSEKGGEDITRIRSRNPARRKRGILQSDGGLYSSARTRPVYQSGGLLRYLPS